MKAATSVGFSNFRGKAGSLVVSGGRSGLVVKNRLSPRNPQTNPQQAVRAYFAKAAAAFKNLSSAQVQAWQAYAQTIVKHNPVSGETYHPTAINAFTALAVKFLQINPAGTIPTTPPAGPFAGDSISLTATAGVGKITFNASGPNTVGVKTELLLQPLASQHRTPQPRAYRSKAIVSLSSLNPSYELTVPAGWYAAAYRFVLTATGQETAIVPLNVQQVTLSVADSGDSKQTRAPSAQHHRTGSRTKPNKAKKAA
jgi:hypothetical protein